MGLLVQPSEQTHISCVDLHSLQSNLQMHIEKGQAKENIATELQAPTDNLLSPGNAGNLAYEALFELYELKV